MVGKELIFPELMNSILYQLSTAQFIQVIRQGSWLHRILHRFNRSGNATLAIRISCFTPDQFVPLHRARAKRGESTIDCLNSAADLYRIRRHFN